MHVLLSIAFLIGELLSILAFENESLLISVTKNVLQISTNDVMNGKHIISQPVYREPTRSYVSVCIVLSDQQSSSFSTKTHVN